MREEKEEVDEGERLREEKEEVDEGERLREERKRTGELLKFESFSPPPVFDFCSLQAIENWILSPYMSRFANNALLGGGVRVRAWIKEQRKIKRRSKALLLSLCWQSWISLNWRQERVAQNESRRSGHHTHIPVQKCKVQQEQSRHVAQGSGQTPLQLSYHKDGAECTDSL